MVSTSMLTTCMSFPMVVLMERTLRINLKCLYVSKVLENLSIFICYCYSHDTFSFFYCIFLVNLLFVTPSKAAVAALTVTDYEIPTLNFKRMSINESICYFLSGNLVNPLDRRSCDLHNLWNGRLFCILLVSAYFCRGQALDGPWSCSSAKKIKNGVNALSGLYLISTVPPSKI